jgi:hypothetical protein
VSEYNQQECDDDSSPKYNQQECNDDDSSKFMSPVHDITIAYETMACINHLEERNALLHERVIELERESSYLVSQVKSLNPELA